MFNKIGANVLFVHDLDVSTRFYRDVLGLEVVFTDPVSVAYRMADQDFLLLKTTAAAEMLGETLVAHRSSVGQHVMLCADVENVDASYNTLVAQGVTFLHAPADQDWGIRSAYFADPDGHIWEIRHSLRSEKQN